MTHDISEAAWHAARAKVVGASEVAALFGCQPPYAMSLFTLWSVKSGRIPPPEVEGERPKWGLKQEEVIAEAVREEKRWHVKRPDVRHATHPRVAGMGCTLDFFCWDVSGAEGRGWSAPGVLESKVADWLIHRRQWGGEPPTHIQLQLQHQLACVDAAWGAVACLVGGNHLEVYEFERRPKIIAAIEAKTRAFWQSIREGKEPPVDGSDSTAAALRALFPEDDGEAEPADLSTDNALPELCRDFLEYAERERQAKEGRGEARNQILAKMGTHRRAVCGGYSINAPAVPDSEGTLVTPEMVGTYVGARRGSRRVTIKEVG